MLVLNDSKDSSAKHLVLYDMLTTKDRDGGMKHKNMTHKVTARVVLCFLQPSLSFFSCRHVV